MPDGRIAVALDDLGPVATEWCGIIQQAGWRAVSLLLRSPIPTERMGAWIIVLPTRFNPTEYGPWLRRIPDPIILVTPHLKPAQKMAGTVPRLAVIVPPFRANFCVADLLTIALGSTAGTLTLADNQPHQTRSLTPQRSTAPYAL